ncbi:hypothetical protein TWF694_003884 [Orbilia ellipsospora]|uniref:Ankyrin n=1 Tax=Orbilia ellipsospora TaxID=2528407 RepID=A0AAV9WZM6_9PEZI
MEVKARPSPQTNFKYIQLLQSTSASGNLSTLHKLLNVHGDRAINSCAKNGKNALHEACTEGHIAMATLLLGSGANINAISIPSRHTALHYAYLHNHAELARMLFTQGADLNAQDENGLTPLMLAWPQSKTTQEGQMAKIYLSQSKLDFTVVCKKKNTYLHYAAAFGGLGDIELCCDRGLEVRAQNNQGTTPLHLAIIGDKPAVQVEYLLKMGASVDDTDEDGDTPLHLSNRAEVVLLLLQNGAKLKIMNKYGFSPGHMACMRAEDPQILDYMATTCDARHFANRKSGIGSINFGSSTMLHIAASRTDDDIALRLVTYLCAFESLDPNVADANKNTALTCTLIGMRSRDLDEDGPDLRASNIVDLLVSNVTDTRAYDTNDPRRSYIMQLLLEKGANPNSLNGGKIKISALGWAIFRGYMPGVEVLLKQPAFNINQHVISGVPALCLVARQDHPRLDIAKTLLKNGAATNARISDSIFKKEGCNATALHMLHGDIYKTQGQFEAGVDMARLLLAHGADINALTSNNRTPLSHAITAKNTLLVNFLLDNGANVHTAGGSAIFTLAEYVSSWDEETFNLLMAQGIDINCRDDNGFPVLRAAILHGNVYFVEKILEAGADVSYALASGETPLHTAILAEC